MSGRPHWLLPFMIVRMGLVTGGAIWQLTLYNPLRETIDTTVVPYEVHLRREETATAMRMLSTTEMQTYNWINRLTKVSWATSPLAAVPLGLSILACRRRAVRGRRTDAQRYTALGLASVEVVIEPRIVCPPPIIASTETGPRVRAVLMHRTRPPLRRRTPWAGFSCCC